MRIMDARERLAPVSLNGLPSCEIEKEREDESKGGNRLKNDRKGRTLPDSSRISSSQSP